MAKKKQLTFIRSARRKIEHGGSLAVGRRRKTRPLNIKQSHHVTMKSYLAVGSRSLFRHKKMILKLIKKNSLHFQVKVYEYSINGNHLHLLVKAQSRNGLQNFFRVVAGHTAQKILQEHPLKPVAGGAPETKPGCRKNQRQFWSYLLYSRIVSWGSELRIVANYIQQNTLEFLQIVAYRPRNLTRNTS